MNGTLFLCVGMGVFVAHLGVFMFLSHLRPLPRTKLPENAFTVRSEVVVDRKTGEKTTYREITVTTRMAAPAATPAPAARPALAEAEEG